MIWSSESSEPAALTTYAIGICPVSSSSNLHNIFFFSHEKFTQIMNSKSAKRERLTHGITAASAIRG